MSKCVVCKSQSGTPWVCQTCLRETPLTLAELPIRYVQLINALPLGRGELALRHVVPESRPPLSSMALELAQELVQWAVEQERFTREILDLRAQQPFRRESVAFVHAVETLRRQVIRLNDSTLVMDIAIESRGWVRRIDVALKRTPLIHRLPAPCPQCNLMTLVRESGQSNVRCTHCHSSWPEEDYRRLTLVLASEVHASQKRGS